MQMLCRLDGLLPCEAPVKRYCCFIILLPQYFYSALFIDEQTDKLTDRQTGRQTDKHADKCERDSERDREREAETGRNVP